LPLVVIEASVQVIDGDVRRRAHVRIGAALHRRSGRAMLKLYGFDRAPQGEARHDDRDGYTYYGFDSSLRVKA